MKNMHVFFDRCVAFSVDKCIKEKIGIPQVNKFKALAHCHRLYRDDGKIISFTREHFSGLRRPHKRSY